MSGQHDPNQKPQGFLNTVFDETMGGFGILWVSILLVTIFLVLLLG